MKKLLVAVSAIATLSIIGCAGPTRPEQPAAEKAPTASEEEAIATIDFESGEAETETEVSEETKDEVKPTNGDPEPPRGE